MTMFFLHAVLTAVTLPQSPALSAAAPAATEDLAFYDPSPAYPFGRRHPDAAPELAQFEFMLGEFDCVDRIRNRDGSWRTTDAIWNAHYFLNGHGIQDVYWNDTFATSNIRIFDPARGQWFVNYFSMPRNQVGDQVWEGQEEGEGGARKMVMWSGSPDRQNGSRLSFYDITEDGFEWVSESLRAGVATPTWRSSCTRRKPGRAPKVPAFRGHDPTLMRPFGRRAEGAPGQLERLAFQVGSFAEGATDRPDGRRTGRWFLNGWGLQSSSYRRGRAEVLIQLFDRQAQTVHVTRYLMPGYEWSVWEGAVGEAGAAIELTEALRNGAAPATARTLRLEPVAGEARYLVIVRDGQKQRAVTCTATR